VLPGGSAKPATLPELAGPTKTATALEWR